MNEIWKPVIGYEDLYEVSSLGRVRSVARACRGKSGSPRPVPERIRKQSSSFGYMRVMLHDDGVKTSYLVHRLVLEAFCGPAPEGHECRHLNGVRSDNRAENLVWGTRAENVADKFLHDTQPRGERSGPAKLTAPDVLLIRASEESHAALGRRFGITRTHVQYIRQRKVWKHLP